MRAIIFLVCAAIVLCLPCISYGLATEEIGSDSEIGHPTTEQPGWTPGIVELPRHPARVYSRWVNGGEDFYFEATPQQVNELIALFSQAKMRDHELRIKAGKPSVQSFNKEPIDYNVHLNIAGGITRAVSEQESSADTFEPDLTIYIEDDTAWVRDLQIPDNIILQSEIEGLLLKSNASKPERDWMYGQVQLKNMDYYAEYQKGYFAVRLTWWDKDNHLGIPLGQVDYKGYLKVPLSEHELSMLLKGDSWLTMTVGNHMAKATKNDPRFPPDKLSIVKETAGVETVSMPEAYYGRILFEDGTPPVLDPAPWPGAEISVDFAYAGYRAVDKQGCFQVSFTDEQYETLKAQKPDKNVYFPSYTKKNTSTAKYIFPVSALTRDKDNPGVVKIPRPETAGE